MCGYTYIDSVPSGSDDIFIANFTPYGKLNWLKNIQQPGSQAPTYQEMDKWGNLNITIREQDVIAPFGVRLKNYVIDTAGTLKKIISFDSDSLAAGYQSYLFYRFPAKARKLSNGGYALSAGKIIGILTDSTGKETHQVIRKYKEWWAVNRFDELSAKFNELWPLDDGGVL